MVNVAMIFGNVHYNNLQDLHCCRDDVLAIKELIEETKKYDDILVVEDADADAMKESIRVIVNKGVPIEELFFYFTGHGYHNEADFFFCAKNFDIKRPNETGVSNAELHTLLRLSGADLVVKVVDACNSGTLLVKSEDSRAFQSKDGFNNIIQIASCLDSQNSLTGDPLSLFTEKFRDSALRKNEGIVYYMDILNTLRDEFISNNYQTPFFVSQCTGREQFVSDGKILENLREKVCRDRIIDIEERYIEQVNVNKPKTLLERLQAAENKVVKPELMQQFIGSFFNKLIDNAANSEFKDFFDIQVLEHSDFKEFTSKKFIISVLSKEKRRDNFVAAEHSRRLRKINPIVGSAIFSDKYIDNDMYDEEWNLDLNCRMEKCQIKITFKPRFISLQQIVLVVSCAPSLENCYVFEVSTQHMLSDFGRYDEWGPEVSRRWWKLNWENFHHKVDEKIYEKISGIIQEQLDNAEKYLSSQ